MNFADFAKNTSREKPCKVKVQNPAYLNTEALPVSITALCILCKESDSAYFNIVHVGQKIKEIIVYFDLPKCNLPTN